MIEKPSYEELEKRIQELTQAEFKYREIEKTLNDILESAGDGICLCHNIPEEPYVRFTHWNPRMIKITGYTMDEINRHGWYQSMYPDPEVQERAIKRMASMREGDDIQAEEWTITRKSGERVPLSISTSIVKKENEKVRVLATMQDISERKKAEQEILNAKQEWQEIFEAIGHPTIILDPEHRVLSSNRATVKMTNMAPNDLIGKKCFEIFHNNDKPPKECPMERMLDSGRLESVEMEIEALGGTFLVSCTPVKDDLGNLIKVIHIATDITLQKENERALHKSEQKFRELVEDINEVIYSVDAKGIVNYISPAVSRLLGHEPKDIIGKAFVDFVHPEDHLRILEKFQEVISGKLGASEYRILSKTGEYRWIRSSSRPVYDDSRLIGLRGAFSDITEEKRLRADLQQAQKMEAIGTLAGGIAHEFNNILGIIIGNTELAIDDVPEWNPAKDCLEEIRTASLRAKDVVRRIMGFARKMPATQKLIKISTIIHESLKLSRATIPTNIEIRQEILCESEMILANPTEIHQILMNLCSNSAHAIEEETGILKIRLESVALDHQLAGEYNGLTAGEYVKLTVKDNGIGIDSKIIDRVIDPYFTTKDVDKGLGMGLAIVYGIVKKHDGAIKVMSKVGIGTTVEILFPATEEIAEIVEEESNDLPRGTERILFVDDEASLVKMAKQMLERQGYDVVGKTSSTEALKLFQEESDRFDLIITDIAMPDMPGDRLAKELIKVRPDLPIILCTGHSERMDEEKAQAFGIKVYILKPLVKADLFKTVRKVLDEAKGSA